VKYIVLPTCPSDFGTERIRAGQGGRQRSGVGVRVPLVQRLTASCWSTPYTGVWRFVSSILCLRLSPVGQEADV